MWIYQWLLEVEAADIGHTVHRLLLVCDTVNINSPLVNKRKLEKNQRSTARFVTQNYINKITSKANSTLAFLRRNLKACPPKLRETAYFSLVRSSLEYSSAVWDPFRQKDIDKLEKIQRSAARFVTQNYRQTASVTSLIQNLGWTDLKTRRKNSRLVSMFKLLNELVEIPNNDRLIKTDRRTRGGHNQAYKHLIANTTLGQNSFWHRTIPDWNSLPAAAIESKTVAAFKSQLVD